MAHMIKFSCPTCSHRIYCYNHVQPAWLLRSCALLAPRLQKQPFIASQFVPRSGMTIFASGVGESTPFLVDSGSPRNALSLLLQY